MRIFVFSVIVLASSSAASAQLADVSREDVQRTPAALNMRIVDRVAAYANRLKLDPEISAYCLQKLHLYTADIPRTATCRLA